MMKEVACSGVIAALPYSKMYRTDLRLGSGVEPVLPQGVQME